MGQDFYFYLYSQFLMLFFVIALLDNYQKKKYISSNKYIYVLLQ